MVHLHHITHTHTYTHTHTPTQLHANTIHSIHTPLATLSILLSVCSSQRTLVVVNNLFNLRYGLGAWRKSYGGEGINIIFTT
ncbi:hypothetical protein EON63_16255 [archaeon]|nr:MAG: hypothetical protein EON63_16255 [archaeon]